MKKRILGIVIVILGAVMLFSACNYEKKEVTYTVTFLNYDNSLLYRATDIQEGEPAIYSGEIPTRPDSTEYTYSFIGWDKDISAIYSNLAVFAKYSETRKTEDNDSNSDNTGGDDIVATQSGEVLNKRYSTVKNSTATDLESINSYYDDNFYYYYFYLGEVNDVPLQAATEVPYYHYTGNYYTKAFKTTKTTTQSVEDACTTAVTNTTTFSSTKEINAGINVKVATTTEAKLSYGIATASASQTVEFGVNVEAGYSRTKGTNDTTSRTNSYKQVATNSETTEETTGFEFTSESKIGYYRYIMTGSVDVYTVVIYSKSDETYYLKTLTEVISFGFSFDYSESSRFDDNQCGALDFDYSIINDLKEPTEPLVEKTDELPLKGLSGSIVTEKADFYVDTTTYLIHDTGYYGLADRNHETIDMSEYSDYFSKNYLFCFAVTLNISKVDSGYQEIYLYNNYKTTSKEVEISTAISSYGLVRGSIMTHSSGAYNHYISWTVRGDELEDIMYIRYDAQGNDEDDWYKNSIFVGLTIVSESKELPLEQTVLKNTNQIIIKDDGVFGLSARSFDHLLLTSYSEYMTSQYIFVFDVTINMHEVDDGYQEIYLYNKYDVTTSSTSKDISYAREHGLVYGTLLEHDRGNTNTSPKNYNFNWVISGNKICDDMYIRYDAYGNDNDTWYKNSITIALKIFYAPPFETDTSVNDVFT